jgi:NADP-dependent alcohol dehydrogenase
MLNFEFYNPTNYIFGKGQIEKLSELIPKNSKILFAFGGGSILKNGIYDQVVESLKNYEVIEFSGIEANPRFETLMKAVQIVREQNVNFILAVGGGSVIDGVKFISAASNFEGDSIDILKKRVEFKNVSKVIPFGTVLTLPATGSEMNSGAVISIGSTQEKLGMGGSDLFPQFSICDPTVIQSLPKRQLQNGVVDAFMHVMEQYLTYPADAILQDRFAESILKTLVNIGPNLVENPSDYKLASNFMWCATMALNGLIECGVPSDWATHIIGHELTALYEIDHARTLATIAPNLYQVMFETKKEKLAQFGVEVFNVPGNSIEGKAKNAIQKMIDFFHKMGIKTKLSEYTNDFLQTDDFIASRFEQRGWNSLGEKQNITIEKVKEIVVASY